MITLASSLPGARERKSTPGTPDAAEKQAESGFPESCMRIGPEFADHPNPLTSPPIRTRHLVSSQGGTFGHTHPSPEDERSKTESYGHATRRLTAAVPVDGQPVGTFFVLGGGGGGGTGGRRRMGGYFTSCPWGGFYLV